MHSTFRTASKSGLVSYFFLCSFLNHHRLLCVAFFFSSGIVSVSLYRFRCLSLGRDFASAPDNNGSLIRTWNGEPRLSVTGFPATPDLMSFFRFLVPPSIFLLYAEENESKAAGGKGNCLLNRARLHCDRLSAPPGEMRCRFLLQPNRRRTGPYGPADLKA